ESACRKAMPRQRGNPAMVAWRIRGFIAGFVFRPAAHINGGASRRGETTYQRRKTARRPISLKFRGIHRGIFKLRGFMASGERGAGNRRVDRVRVDAGRVAGKLASLNQCVKTSLPCGFMAFIGPA